MTFHLTRKTPTDLAKYKTVAGAFVFAILLCVSGGREASASGFVFNFTATPHLYVTSNSSSYSNFYFDCSSVSSGLTQNTAIGGWGTPPLDFNSYIGSGFDPGVSGSGDFCQVYFYSTGTPTKVSPPSGSYDYVSFNLSSDQVVSNISTTFVSPTLTRIISVTPSGTIATGTQSFGFSAYVASSSWTSSDYWTLSMTPLDSINLLPGQGIYTNDYIQLASGTVSFSTTTDFVATGNYALTIHYFHANCGLFGFSPGFCFSQLLATTTDFVVSTTSQFRQLEGTIQTEIDSALASTTLAFGSVCSPFGTSFDPATCIALVVVPSSDSINADLSMLEQQAPWGYAFRFYDILIGSSSSALPIISATVPNSLPGAGASINLDINHSLDFFLNATSSVFNNASASSTQTWGQIITQYFTYLVQIGFVTYIIARIFSLRMKDNMKDI